MNPDANNAGNFCTGIGNTGSPTACTSQYLKMFVLKKNEISFFLYIYLTLTKAIFI